MNVSSGPPQVITDRAEIRDHVETLRRQGLRVGLVPTMGALHAGHMSLVDAARGECDATIATIFVNPTQFGPNEDFSRYPRTWEADLAALSEHGAAIVFAPAAETMYRPGAATRVDVGPVAAPWEGAHRPGHFQGVATIVLKLFNLIPADVAFFGRKDYQQALVIRRMVDDLDLPIEVRVRPTAREPDGLAMSSRNRYLSPEERQRALAISRSLVMAHELVRSGQRRADLLASRVRQRLETEGRMKVDYVAVADPRTLAPVDTVEGEAVMAIAARVGATRLIDNATLGADDPNGAI